jgi:hypothetical protein
MRISKELHEISKTRTHIEVRRESIPLKKKKRKKHYDDNALVLMIDMISASQFERNISLCLIARVMP